MKLHLAILIAMIALPTAALADPCNAIPDRGPLPAYLSRGAVFSGPVRYVGDADSLCVGVRILLREPEQWVEVRLADFYGPELHAPGGRQAKAALERITRGRTLRCVFEKRSYDRAVSRCTINGRSVGDLMRQAGIQEGGRGR